MLQARQNNQTTLGASQQGALALEQPTRMHWNHLTGFLEMQLKIGTVGSYVAGT